MTTTISDPIVFPRTLKLLAELKNAELSLAEEIEATRQLICRACESDQLSAWQAGRLTAIWDKKAKRLVFSPKEKT